MQPQTFEELARRLTTTEEQLAASCAEVRLLKESIRRVNRSRGAGPAVGVVLVVLAFGAGRSAVTHAEGQSVTAPFTVVDQAGRKIVEIAESGDQSKNGLFLFNKEEQEVAEMRSDAWGDGRVIVTNKNANSNDGARIVLTTSPEGDGIFAVYDRTGKSIADIYRGKSGGQGFGVYDAKGDLAVELGAWDDGTAQLDLRSGKQFRTFLRATEDSSFLELDHGSDGLAATWLGYEPGLETDSTGQQHNTEMRGLQVFLNRGSAAAEVLSINADAGGMVKVYDGKGRAQATMLGFDDGGRVLVGDANSDAHVEMHGEKGVLVYNKTNAIAVLGGQESGLLELSNPGGQAVVQAGMLPDGRGIVRGGPVMGGMVGIPGLPWAIMGKLEK
jgi:hypothetical protein